MKILKLPFKILAIPVIAVLSLISAAGFVMNRISCYMVFPVLFYLGICGFMCVIMHLQGAVLVAMIAAVIALPFLLFLISVTARDCREALLRFLYS